MSSLFQKYNYWLGLISPFDKQNHYLMIYVFLWGQKGEWR